MKIKSITFIGVTKAEVAIGAPVTDDSGKQIGKVIIAEVNKNGYIEVTAEITDKEVFGKLKDMYVEKYKGISIGEKKEPL